MAAAAPMSALAMLLADTRLGPQPQVGGATGEKVSNALDLGSPLRIGIGGCPGCEVGDELQVQVFFRDEHADLARAQAAEWPQLPTVAELLLPTSPAWLSKLWPRRRDPSLWGMPVEFPDGSTGNRWCSVPLKPAPTG